MHSDPLNETNCPDAVESDVDVSKRSSLKIVAASVAGVMAASSSLVNAMPSLIAAPASEGTTVTGHLPSSELGSFSLQVQHSWAANDLEVVITNTGEEAHEITMMTPAVLKTARGQFNFAALFEDGPLIIKAGEQVRVPMQHIKVDLSAPMLGHFDTSLQKRLRSTVTMVTGGDSLASITVPNGPRIV